MGTYYVGVGHLDHSLEKSADFRIEFYFVLNEKTYCWRCLVGSRLFIPPFELLIAHYL